jgi:hypothetical protein
MAAKRIDIHDLRFEEKDAEIFKIADTKTRLDTLQNYFFPRLEALLQDTVALLQDIYGVNPYGQMTMTSRPQHRRNARQNFDYGDVYIGRTGKRRTDRFLITRRADGTPFSYHSCELTYTVEPFGSLHVRLSGCWRWSPLVIAFPLTTAHSPFSKGPLPCCTRFSKPALRSQRGSRISCPNALRR